MNKLPPHRRNEQVEHSICLILEGFEEDFYFKRLKLLPLFSKVYAVKLVNAKSASNIPAKYQEANASNSYSIVLIVCDKDRKPESYSHIVKEIDKILGEGNAEKIITFTRPCTLQVILYHFGEAVLKTQAKAAARDDVERLTGVSNYDAHQDQLEAICNKIYLRSCSDMIERLKQLSMNPDDIPSSNMLLLFEYLRSDDYAWIKEVNDSILCAE